MKMKTKNIFYILLFSSFSFSMLGGLIHIIQYYPNQKEVNIGFNDTTGIFLQISLVLIGLFLGLVLFAPRDKKEYTKEDFIRHKEKRIE